jgi:micrococcal nuclease
MTILAILTASYLCIASVHDGDTIRLCDGERIRIANIDAPEMEGSSRCDRGRGGWCDYDLAIRSRDALREFLASGNVTITRQGQDRYGRTLARVTVNGRDAGAYLIGQGFAKRWGSYR